MLKRSLTILVSAILFTSVQVQAVPVIGILSIAQWGKMITEGKDIFSNLNKQYQNYAKTVQLGAGEQVDTINNAASNTVSRINAMFGNVSNERLKQSEQSVDICTDYATSMALNDFVCDALNKISSSGDSFSKNIFDPYAPTKNIDQKKIDDTSLLTNVYVNKALPKASIMEQYYPYRQAAFYGTSQAVLSTVKNQRESMVNPLANTSIDNMSPDAIQQIQDDSRSQVMRKMAVMKAQRLAAMMMQYKDELNSEYVLAQRLILKVDMDKGE